MKKLRNYVVDDGWNLPENVFEEIDLCICCARDKELIELTKLKKSHKGKWISYITATLYETKAQKLMQRTNGQFIGPVRRLIDELMDKYGVTEVEATNIIQGKNIEDYVNKYYRIKNLLVTGVDEQAICNEVVERFLRQA